MQVIRVSSAECRPGDLAPAVEWLRAGKIVAFPTDTFYGLAVDPVVRCGRARSVRAEGAAGARGAAARRGVEPRRSKRWCGQLGSATARLAAAFWPGPLSLVFDAPASVSVAVHGGSRTVAIRVPDHPVARALAEAWGAPVTATSANRTGAPPASDATALGAIALDPQILVIDAGPTPGGAPSTIVDARGRAPTLVREGAIAWDRVLESLQA